MKFPPGTCLPYNGELQTGDQPLPLDDGMHRVNRHHQGGLRKEVTDNPLKREWELARSAARWKEASQTLEEAKHRPEGSRGHQVEIRMGSGSLAPG